MPYIVQITDFATEPLYIPNKVSMNTSAPGAPISDQLLIDRLIEVYEPELLISALGITYYTELLAALDLLPFNDAAVLTADQKWIDLVNGHTYEIDGREFRWEGLAGRSRTGLIAWYIKAMYLKHKDEELTMMGAMKLDGKGAQPRTNTDKFVRAWQTFMRMYQDVDTEKAVVSQNKFGTVGYDYYSTKNNVRSLRQYVYDLETLPAYSSRFPDLQFNVITLDESYNSFDF